MSRQGKHIRLQVAHKAAQMMVEEGISDYAFAKRKAAKFFGLMDGDTLPSNEEINEAIREHQAIYFDEKHEERLKTLRLEALNLMKKLNAFNPYLTGRVLDGSAGRYPKINIQLFTDSMKDLEFFLINHNIVYETRDRKSFDTDTIQDKKTIPVLMLQGNTCPIELMVYHFNDLLIKKTKASIKDVEILINTK